jgi:hypothetical protein
MTDKARVIASVRKGSRLAYWKPHGILEAILECHPEHPPRLHYIDQRGTVELAPIEITSDAELTLEIGAEVLADARPGPPCPECGVAEGMLHADDCPVPDGVFTGRNRRKTDGQ